jgi:hypothetical protein
LRLDPLTRIHDQDSAFTGGQGSRDLIGEVHVPRSVDEIQLIAVPVSGLIIHADCVELDGDPPLSFQLVRIQDLFPHLPLLERPGMLQKPIGQGGFPMVDMGDDGEISYVISAHVDRTASLEIVGIISPSK